MLNGLSILIVEDEPFIALMLADAVEYLGGQVVGPAATVAQALSLIETASAVAAILDTSLLDSDVTPLALHLLEKGVPFVIHTATGIPDQLAASHPRLTVLIKPASPIRVIEALLEEIECRA